MGDQLLQKVVHAFVERLFVGPFRMGEQTHLGGEQEAVDQLRVQFRAFRPHRPAGVDQQQMQADMMRNMAGSLGTQAWIGVAISLIGLALLIASFVRRLRDAGLPVLIAIIPVLTTLISSYASLSAVDDLRAAMLSENMQTMNEAATASSGLGLAAYIGYLVVIVCGVFPSRNAD